jgi:uncharacterized protein
VKKIMPQEIKKQLELRTLTSSNYEIRESEAGEKYIEGYAIEWEKLSSQLGWWKRFKEKFQKGAFDDYLRTDNDTKFLLDHHHEDVLGRTIKGTLELKSDDKGLWYSLKVPNTTQGKDTLENVRNGNKEHISIGFKMLGEEWDESDENNIIRTVTKANLPEISLTAFPAYPDTSASTRSEVDPYKMYWNERENKDLYKKSISIRKKKLELLEKL